MPFDSVPGISLVLDMGIDFIFVIAIVCPSLYFAKNTDECCAGAAKEARGKCEILELSCPPNHVIYKPEVHLTSYTCKSEKRCDGADTTPPFTAHMFNCYWKNKCSINLSEDFWKIWSNPNSNCYGKDVKNVIVKKWKCVNESDISDTCPGGKIDVRSHKGHGIIRSHQMFPWNYHQGIFGESANTSTSPCVVQFSGYLQADVDYSHVAISVDKLDIDDDASYAKIENEGLKKDSSPYIYHTKEPIDVTFGLKQDMMLTKSGAGFVLCYRFLKVNEMPEHSICDERELMKTKQGHSAKCIHRHQFCPLDRSGKRMYTPVHNNYVGNVCKYHKRRRLNHSGCSTEKVPTVCSVRAKRAKGIHILNIHGNFTEKEFTCKWLYKGTNGKQWTVSLGTTDIDRRTDNITVVHYPCKKKGSSKTYLFSGDDTVMRPQTLTKGEVITLEYIRRKVTGSYIESDDWPPSTKFEMFIKKNMRTGNGKKNGRKRKTIKEKKYGLVPQTKQLPDSH